MDVTRKLKNINIRDSTLNKNCSGLIGNHIEMPNVSYTPTYEQFEIRP